MGVCRFLVVFLGIKWLVASTRGASTGLFSDSGVNAGSLSDERGAWLKEAPTFSFDRWADGTPVGRGVYSVEDWKHDEGEDELIAVEPRRFGENDSGPGLTGRGLVSLGEKLSVASLSEGHALLNHFAHVVKELQTPYVGVTPKAEVPGDAYVSVQQHVDGIISKLRGLMFTSASSGECPGFLICPAMVMPFISLFQRTELLLCRLALEGNAHDMIVTLREILPPLQSCLRAVEDLPNLGPVEVARDSLIARVREQDRALEDGHGDVEALAENYEASVMDRSRAVGAAADDLYSGIVFTPATDQVTDPPPKKALAIIFSLMALAVVVVPIIIYGVYESRFFNRNDGQNTTLTLHLTGDLNGPGLARPSQSPRPSPFNPHASPLSSPAALFNHHTEQSGGRRPSFRRVDLGMPGNFHNFLPPYQEPPPTYEQAISRGMP